MREFSVLRYLKKFSIWILLLAIAGSVGIYIYGKTNQEYTASVVIEYTNDGAADGLTPDGSKIDTDEIYSSTVVTSAQDDLGLTGDAEVIRAGCSVEEVITDEQATKNEALLEQGEDPEFFATTYKVRFVAGGDKSADYARDVLDAIIKNYCTFYTEKYIEQSVLPNGTSELTDKEYDYIDCASVIESTTADMLEYLQIKKDAYPDFRASSTGYTYTDLYDIYEHFYNYEVPSLYAKVLTSGKSTAKDELINRLNNELDEYELAIEDGERQADYLEALMETYTEQNKDAFDYNYNSDDEDTSASDYILNDIEQNDSGADVLTSYDSLLDEYVGIKEQIAQNEVDLRHVNYLLKAFESDKEEKISDEELKQVVDSCIENLNTYYALVKDQGMELNENVSAKNLQMLSSVNVSSAINLKLYIVLAAVFFLIVGVLGAILIGRIIDFVEYFMFVDHTVNMANRARCDQYIAELSRKLLPESMACAYISVSNLKEISDAYGRNVGDEALKEFAEILKAFADAYGFVGYNGAGQYMAFFPECNDNKLEAILAVLKKQVSEFNKRSETYKIKYTCGTAVSTTENIYEARALLKLAIGRNMEKTKKNS